MVNTRFWIDDYISNLDPTEKLLFLYCLTNPSTDISGIYEIPLKTIVVDTGIKKDLVMKILNKFESDNKIKYENGWIAIKNFIKHQKDNPKIKRGIEISVSKCPDWCTLWIDYIYSMDRLSHSNYNTNTNTNTEINKKVNGSENIINTMYNYVLCDENGNPIKHTKIKTRISKDENNFLISVGLLWQDMASKMLNISKDDVVMKNIYYPIRECYMRDKFKKEDFKKLFEYFFKDPAIKYESKLAFDLCLSQKYVAKFKLSKNNQNITNVDVIKNIKL